MRKSNGSLLPGVVALCLCSSAFGAEPAETGTSLRAASAPRDSQVIEEVVVTAERRSQSLQSIPLSIQAFSADKLEKTGTASNIELQMLVPGLVMTNNSGLGQIYIRGIGGDIAGSGVDVAVAVYVDGVYQSRPSASALKFVDVERVEVLKGPQGTLYGRNATGGAINIISRAPAREHEGQIDGQLGSFSQKILRGTVSGPLSEGVAYARLSAVINKDDGYMNNALLNTRGFNSDTQAIRGALEFTPSAALNVLLNAHYYDDKTAPLARPLNKLFNPAYTVFKATWLDDPYTVMQNTQSGVEVKQQGVAATIRYDVNGARLTSVTAARKDSYYLKGLDLDLTEVNFVKIGSPTRAVGLPEDTKFYSQDFTLASNTNGPLQWTALASFMHQKVDYMTGVQLPIVGVISDTVGSLTTEATGIGGQASYSLGNGITLTAGTRYSKESKENVATGTTNGRVTARQDAKTTWTAWTPKLVAEYAANKRVMLYTSATKGFKSGGYNTNTLGPAWQPEKVTSLEAGLKSTWLDGQLRVNAALFDMKYDDLQLQFTNQAAGGPLLTVTTNAAKATSRGFELNLVARPTARFELSGGIQVLDAKFDKYVTTNALQPALGAVDQKGNPLLRAPDLTLNIGLQYKWPAAFAGSDVTLRADGYRRSRIYYTAFKDPLASDELGFLGNVQLSFEPSGIRGMYGAVFVKNITDKLYYNYMTGSSTSGYVTAPAAPRTVGAQLGYRY